MTSVQSEALHLLYALHKQGGTYRMDAFELLKADHRKVEELFEELESASGKTKISVFNQIKTELELHTQLEEKIFYPALEKPSETHDLTLEAYEEHDVVKKLLRELSRAKTPNEEWEAKAKVLQENVEHHVEEEENQLFPKAEKARKLSGKKSGSSKKASVKKSVSKAAKRTGTGKKAASRKSSSKSSKSAGRSGTKKSAKKSRR